MLWLSLSIAMLSCQKTNEQTSLGSVPAQILEEKTMNMKIDFHEGAEVFFVLKNREIIPTQKMPPEGFYVRGKIERGRFKPQSGVLGIGELANVGRYGWLELNSKEFFPMESDRKADMPFVKGYLIEEEFKPSERDVIMSP